jgi:3-oxoacyl-[acyl-carrier-protein] synthase II
MAAGAPRDAVITGIGLISSLAEGIGEHVRLLTGNQRPAPQFDTESFAPYPFHPMVELDLSQQIPKRDQQHFKIFISIIIFL